MTIVIGIVMTIRGRQNQHDAAVIAVMAVIFFTHRDIRVMVHLSILHITRMFVGGFHGSASFIFISL